MGIVNSIIEFILLAFIGIGSFMALVGLADPIGNFITKFWKKDHWLKAVVVVCLTAYIVGIFVYLIITTLTMLLNFIGLDIDVWSWLY